MDLATVLLDMIVKEKPYGVYHLANDGKVNYYDFVLKVREILEYDNAVHRAKDKDFKALGHKPLRTPIKSVKLDPIRHWQDALEEYLNEYCR